MTRVRYEKQSDGSLVSTQSFVAGTEIVSAQITQDLTVSVRQFTGSNASLGNVLLEQTALSLVQAKRLSKSMLKSMGVQFSDEVRNTLSSALELTDSSDATPSNTESPSVPSVAAASN